MIRFQRFAQARGDKFLEAAQWAKEVTEYINSNYPEASVQVFTEQYGAYGAIYWHSDAEDIATIDRFGAQLMTDEGYLTLLSQSEGYFIEGATKDTLMQTI
jgi:hypothetical protein